MSTKQKSLTSFFKPVQTKRVSSDPPDEEEISSKKPKLETCDETSLEKKCVEETEPAVSADVKCVTSEDGERTDSQEKKTNEGNLKDQTKTADVSYSQASTQEAKSDTASVSTLDEGKSYSQRSTQEVKDKVDKQLDNDSNVLKDVTKDDNNKNNVTPPATPKCESKVMCNAITPVTPKTEAKFISTPLGMLSPLQCMAKIKSQCAKTPALHSSIGATWFFALQGEFTKTYFSKLSEFLVAERKKSTIYPPEHQVWSWTQLCTMKEVKVVVLGQDPYHNPGQAHGLCFSVQKGVPPPPSLINMYKELESDIPGFKAPRHGNLTGWAQQGVLLLNACLTVRANCANSHKDQGWEQLTDAVIKRLSDTGNGIVFLLWGSYAQKKGSMVNKKKHHILQTTHPSPLSAHRGFLGCKHFSKCNDLLKKSGKKPIDWTHLPLV